MTEPIRPIGFSEDGMVRRAEAISRVARHREGDEDEETHERRREAERRQELLAHQHERIWTTRPDAAPAQIAGAYDDHGHVAAADATAPRRHLDASA